MVVIRIGRRRAWLAATRASKVLSPTAFLLLAKSTSMMAFFATRPMSMIIPKIVKTFSVWFVSAIRSSAPMNESGTEKITMNGVAKLSYRATITKYIRTIAANKANPNVPKPSDWFSMFPPHLYSTPAFLSSLENCSCHSVVMVPVGRPIAFACTDTEGVLSLLSNSEGPEP